MNDLGDKRRNAKRIMIISLVLACTVVGGAGIIMAPKSDQDKLKEELARNEQALQQTEDAEPESETKAAASGTVASGEPGEEGREKGVERKITVTGQELIDYLGKDRKIYWINAHGKDVSWQDTVNKTIQKLAKKNENLQVIDWTKRAEKHPDWFYRDGTHLNEKGQKGFAEFIWEEVSGNLP